MNKRTYISLFHTDINTEKTKEIKFPFDLINKVSVDIDLTVCTFDTVRGRNKTDHSYINQKTIGISGAFSERTINNINKEFFNYGGNKLKNIQNLFLSFIEDNRLFYIYTRYKTYKNYVLKRASFTFSSSVSAMTVDLDFVEIMLRNNPELYSDYLVENFKPTVTYAPPLTDALIDRPVEKVNKVDKFKISETPITTEPSVTSKEPSVTAKETVVAEVLPEKLVKGDVDLVKTYNKVVVKSHNLSRVGTKSIMEVSL